MKGKIDKLDVDKLVHVTVDLNKVSDVVKNDVIEKDVYNAKIKNIDDRIPYISNLATNTTLNAKMNEVKGEIPCITNFATATALIAVKTKCQMLVIYSKRLTITQGLVKFKIKLLLIMIIIKILLLKNLTS